MAPTFEYLPLRFGTEIECFTILPRHVVDEFGYHLNYLASEFRKKYLRVRVDNIPDRTDYSQFSLTSDGSLYPELSTREIATRLDITVDDAMEWHEQRAELVSPPMPAPYTNCSSHALAQEGHGTLLRDYVHALTAGEHHRSFVSELCGLHILFGLEDGSHIPLAVLQHLAFILVKYEPVISDLHHYWRTPYPGRPAASYCKSNRTAFLADGHTCHKNPRRVIDLAIARSRIFKPGMTVDYLVWLMCSDEIVGDDGEAIPALTGHGDGVARSWNKKMSRIRRNASLFGKAMTALQATTDSVLKREPKSKIAGKEKGIQYTSKYKLSRWNLIGRDDEGPQTIEFRQPAGTLDTDEIGYWIQLYTAIIRTAERLAANAQSTNEAEPATLENFLHLLQLTDPVREYWRSRADKMADERREANIVEDTLTSAQKCFLCANREDGTYASRRKQEKWFLKAEKKERPPYKWFRRTSAKISFPSWSDEKGWERQTEIQTVGDWGEEEGQK